MRGWHPPHRDAAAYGLGVLDDPGAFEAHLSGCAHCRVLVAEFRSVTGALTQASQLGYLPWGRTPDRGQEAGPGPSGESYPPPGKGAARRRKSCAVRDRRGSAAGPLLLLVLGVAVTALSAARPATTRTRFASTASIVSPAQVVAGTGAKLRDLPWRAGFK
jgi:anti-sigma factor RsiW